MIISAKWLVDMAEYISNNPQIIVNGFIRSGITGAVDGTMVESDEDEDNGSATDTSESESEEDNDPSLIHKSETSMRRPDHLLIHDSTTMFIDHKMCHTN